MKRIASLMLVLGVIVVPQFVFSVSSAAAQTKAELEAATKQGNASGFDVADDRVGGAAFGVAGTGQTPTAIIKNIINYALAIVGFLGVLGFIISGIMYLVSAGDEGQAEKAKGYMVNSIIGVIVALLGYVVMAAVSTLLIGDTAGGNL